MIRRLIAPQVVAGIALVAAGCGGSSSTTTNPPPTNTTPASVVVQAGDGQQAAPGAAVATSPAVLVTNSAGQPIPGVTVTFTIDSGGGSLSTTSATTGANGIATAGTWTLGSSEGRNTLRVTVGSLSPVKIAATAVVAATSYPPVTIGTGGGSISVTQPGPLNGFSITVPAGAFSTGITATVSYASNASVPRTSTVVPLSPLITISTTTTDYATTPLTIHVPGTVPAGDFPVIVIYDPSSGAREVLTTIAWDANGATAITNTLSAARVLGSSSVRANGSRASLQGPGATVLLEGLPNDVLMADYDSGYRPGVDDWEFNRTLTEVDLAKDDPLYTTVGDPATSLWYFNAHPAAARLNGRFMVQAGVPLSDRLGMRWVSTIGYQFDVFATNTVLHAIDHRAADAAAFDQNQFHTIRARFAVSAQDGARARPQLMAFILNGSGQPFYLIVYRVAGNQLFVADPLRSGDVTRAVTFPPGAAMTPYLTGPNGNDNNSLREPLAAGLSTLVSLDQLAASYAQVLDGTIGQDKFPTYEMHGWAGRLYDTLFIVDTLRWWIECPQCTNTYATTLSPPPGGKLAAQVVYDANATSGTAFYARGVSTTTATPPAAGADRPLASIILSANAPQASSGSGYWLDWHPYVLRRLQTGILPASPTQTPGTPLSLTFQVAQTLLPPHVNYVWDFGDHQPVVTVTVADNPVVQHTYAAVGTYQVTAKIIDVRNNQVIGLVTAPATITATPVWRFTSLALTSESGPNPITHVISPSYDADGPALANVKNNMARITAIPSDGLLLYFNQYYRDNLGVWPFSRSYDQVWLQIAQTPGAGATVTRWLGQFFGTSGNFDVADQCAPPRTALQCGADNLAYTGTAANATLVGLGGRASWGVSPPIILGDWSWWQIAANVNGNTLSGTLTYTQQMVADPPNNFLGPHVITWTFTATRVP